MDESSDLIWIKDCNGIWTLEMRNDSTFSFPKIDVSWSVITFFLGNNMDRAIQMRGQGMRKEDYLNIHGIWLLLRRVNLRKVQEESGTQVGQQV